VKDSRNIPMRVLEEKSGFPRTMINFYIREGLLPAPEKSAKNMAYYDEKFLEKLALIRKLKDAGVPLAQMKQLMGGETGSVDVGGLLESMRSISSLLPLAAIDKPVSLDEIRETGVGDDIINGLIRLSVIRATDADKTLFPSDSITICRIAKFFHDFGIPLGALRDMMHELRKIVEVETRAFNKYLGDTKSFLSLEERDALIRECIENINTLLPLLHLQLLNSARRRKSQDREKQGPRGA